MQASSSRGLLVTLSQHILSKVEQIGQRLRVAVSCHACRIVAPMSDTEKLINKQLLEKVAQTGVGAPGQVVRTKTAATKQQQSKS